MGEEDLFQEGMLAFMRAEMTFNAAAGVKFETYASRVITNRFIDLARKSRKNTTFNEETAAPNDTDFDDAVKLIEIKKVLHDRMNELDRAIFNSYIEGFSYEEISKIFELPRKKIDNIVQKVKRVIKENMN